MDLAAQTISVRNSEGSKDRTTVLPLQLGSPLERHLLRAGALHRDDLAQGAGLAPIVGDFDGDAKADIGYVAPPAGGQSAVYSILQSSTGYSFAAGQVLFVPREEVTLRDCTEEELAAIARSAEQFSREKAAARIMTPYGMPYSPHYLRQSRSTKA